jgi:Protein of unknown function (DUF732)
VDEQPETAIGPANDETQVVAKDAETQLGGMAWSEDDTAEPVRHSWESAWGRAAVLVSVGTAVATATVLGWMVVHRDHDPQQSAHPTSDAATASSVATAPPVVIPPSTVTVQIPPPTTVTVQAAPSMTTPVFSDGDGEPPESFYDQRFIDRMRSYYGLPETSNSLALKHAHEICGLFRQGMSVDQVESTMAAEMVVAKTRTWPLVSSAMAVYPNCGG